MLLNIGKPHTKNKHPSSIHIFKATRLTLYLVLNDGNAN